ncbi:MAG: hypothetical protein GYA45_11695 [Pelolinea sp.]|nr:hypothetical protein [Pelolinea sp.]
MIRTSFLLAGYTLRLTVIPRLPQIQQMAGLIKELCSTPRGNANPCPHNLGMNGSQDSNLVHPLSSAIDFSSFARSSSQSKSSIIPSPTRSTSSGGVGAQAICSSVLLIRLAMANPYFTRSELITMPAMRLALANSPFRSALRNVFLATVIFMASPRRAWRPILLVPISLYGSGRELGGNPLPEASPEINRISSMQSVVL